MTKFRYISLIAVVLFFLSGFGCTSHTDLHVQSSNDRLGNQTMELHRDADLKALGNEYPWE